MLGRTCSALRKWSVLVGDAARGGALGYCCGVELDTSIAQLFCSHCGAPYSGASSRRVVPVSRASRRRARRKANSQPTWQRFGEVEAERRVIMFCLGTELCVTKWVCIATLVGLFNIAPGRLKKVVVWGMLPIRPRKRIGSL